MCGGQSPRCAGPEAGGGREPAGPRAPEVRGPDTPERQTPAGRIFQQGVAPRQSRRARGNAARPRPLQVERGQVRRPGFSQAQLCPPRIRRSSRRPEVALWSVWAERGGSRGPHTPSALRKSEANTSLSRSWGFGDSVFLCRAK